MEAWLRARLPFYPLAANVVGFKMRSSAYFVKASVLVAELQHEAIMQNEAWQSCDTAAAPVKRCGICMHMSPDVAPSGYVPSSDHPVFVIVTPAIAGTTMATLLARCPAGELLDLAEQLFKLGLGTLAELEAAEIAHQDPKCDNIVISAARDSATLVDYELAVSKKHPNPSNAGYTGAVCFASIYAPDLHRLDVAVLYFSILRILRGRGDETAAWRKFAGRHGGTRVADITPQHVEGYATYVNPNLDKGWKQIQLPSEALASM